jgi:hypothetical protein
MADDPPAYAQFLRTEHPCPLSYLPASQDAGNRIGHVTTIIVTICEI